MNETQLILQITGVVFCLLIVCCCIVMVPTRVPTEESLV